MDNNLISGLFGALLGATIPIVIMKIQLNAQAKRDRINLATNLAIEDYKNTIEINKINRKYHYCPK